MDHGWGIICQVRSKFISWIGIWAVLEAFVIISDDIYKIIDIAKEVGLMLQGLAYFFKLMQTSMSIDFD